MLPNLRAMVINISDSYDTAKTLFIKTTTASKKTTAIKFLNKLGVFFNFTNGQQSYDAFYVANNHNKIREIKFFDFTNSKILTICATTEDYDKYLSLHSALCKDYNQPAILNQCDNVKSYEISMVRSKPRPNEIKALSQILSSNISYNRIPSKKILTSELMSHSYCNTDIVNILNHICNELTPDLLNLEIPICLQHGDLSRDNLIYGESNGLTDFWWIDWEHVSPRIFLYDYFFYIVNTAYCYHDLTAFNIYINGHHNQNLRVFFEHFGVPFCADNLKDYILIFLIVFFKERLCDKDYIDVLKDYYDYVKKLKLLA